jgi:hypothetical protein
MALETAMVAATPPREPTTCLPMRLPTRALLLVLALSMYSGFALSLQTDFGKMICKGFLFKFIDQLKKYSGICLGVKQFHSRERHPVPIILSFPIMHIFKDIA